jgi:hypothetical protein
MAPRARPRLLKLPDRVEKTPPPRARGKQLPPCLTRCCPAVGADRARVLGGLEGLGGLGTRASAPLHGPRIGGLDSAPPQDSTAAHGGRDRTLVLGDRGELLLGPQIAGPRVRVLHRGADQRRATAGPPGARPAQGIAAKDIRQRIQRPPPGRPERAVSIASVRPILEGMMTEGRRLKTAPVACH